MSADYNKDFAAWSAEQAAFLEQGDFAALDLVNLCDEIGSLGRQEIETLKNDFIGLIAVRLTYLVREIADSPSAQRVTSIELALKRSIQTILRESPSLQQRLNSAFLKSVWERAILQAVMLTDLSEESFPQKPLWSLEEMMRMPYCAA